MRRELLPFNLFNVTLRGFEDDDKDDKDDKSGSDDDGDDDDDDKDDKGSGNDQNADALKSALRKERLERRRLEKENKALQKTKQEKEDKEKSETDKAKDDAAKAAQRAEKLAQRLKTTAVDNAIIKLGGKLKFRDIDDALKLIDRDEIEVDQDEDDPSDVTIDESSVEEALKALAKKKPHLIVAEGQEDKSGSKFNGQRKTQKEIDDEELRSKYPALKRSSHS